MLWYYCLISIWSACGRATRLNKGWEKSLLPWKRSWKKLGKSLLFVKGSDDWCSVGESPTGRGVACARRKRVACARRNRIACARLIHTVEKRRQDSCETSDESSEISLSYVTYKNMVNLSWWDLMNDWGSKPLNPISLKPHVPMSNPKGVYVFCTMSPKPPHGRKRPSSYGRKWPMMGASDPWAQVTPMPAPRVWCNFLRHVFSTSGDLSTDFIASSWLARCGSTIQLCRCLGCLD